MEEIPSEIEELFDDANGDLAIGELPAAIEKYRVVAVLVGLTVFVAMLLILNRSKIGLLIRAGVENTEMVDGSNSASSSLARSINSSQREGSTNSGRTRKPSSSHRLRSEWSRCFSTRPLRLTASPMEP